MILLDSNIFIIDRFFKRDVHYAVNRQLVEALPTLDAAISLYGLLEICGLASFNLSKQELAQWFYHFDQSYAVSVLYPPDLERSAEQYFVELLDEMYQHFAQGMTFIDAVILSTAEAYQVSHLITWNVKHFAGRTAIPVLTPEAFLNLSP